MSELSQFLKVKGKPFSLRSRTLSTPFSSTNPIIHYFNKTPPSIVCPHFYELRWASGCPFDCAYCYLRGTFRGDKKPKFNRDLKEILLTLDAFFNKNEERPRVFNTGELSDSLMNPPMMEKIAEKFNEQNKHKLLILTKSDNVDFMLKREFKQVIPSFSINALKPAFIWEKGAPSPDKRIEAAKKLSESGYDVRVRIDPIFPVTDWKGEYSNIIDTLLSKFSPERVTLGTPRGLQKTLMYAKDKTWTNYFSEKSGWGKKIATSLRIEIYSFIFEKLREYGFEGNISVCKESVDMWKELGWNPGKYPRWNNCKCNCSW